MLEGWRGIVVAVSGGPDSIALLDILQELTADERSIDPPLVLHVAHLDHQLRGEESKNDAEFVRSLAHSSGLPCTIGSADIRELATRSGKGIEETAREARYAFLLETALRIGADRIAVGHTMDDQAETFLMRLIRGAGAAGLGAMRPVIPAHLFQPGPSATQYRTLPEPDAAPECKLIRPLLCLSRKQIEYYCKERGLAFRLDPTNLESDYTRNRIRNHLLPLMRQLNPKIIDAIARAADSCAADDEALSEIANRALEAAQRGRFVYSIEQLLSSPPGVVRRMIIEALRRIGGSDPMITALQVETVESLLREGRSGQRVTLGGGITIYRYFDVLEFINTQEKQEPYLMRIDSSCEQVEAGGLRLKLIRSVPGSSLETLLNRAKKLKAAVGRNWMMAILDDRLLPPVLLVRPRRPGEEAAVCGQGGPKKLKKLMIDHRIPTSHRDSWPLVVTPNDAYVWSPGLPPASQYAARYDSIDLASIEASEAQAI